MSRNNRETLPIRQEPDVMKARRLVGRCAKELGLGNLGQTRAVTAASELARNTLIHGGGGTMLLETVARLDQRGLQLTFEDEGAGIADIEQAMQDGYTTGGGLGLGLSGSRRLMDDFEIESVVDQGTRVKVTIWT
jgi:serine/threonine-protein kinase RsbT